MVFKNNLVKPTDVSKYNFCGWSVDLDTDMEDAEEKCRKVITAEKFGIVSCVDVQKTIKKKINKDIRPYLILGACSPPHAFNAVGLEEHIGLLMPCNVLL